MKRQNVLSYLGGGPIGSELAQSFARLGSKGLRSNAARELWPEKTKTVF